MKTDSAKRHLIVLIIVFLITTGLIVVCRQLYAKSAAWDEALQNAARYQAASEQAPGNTHNRFRPAEDPPDLETVIDTNGKACHLLLLSIQSLPDQNRSVEVEFTGAYGDAICFLNRMEGASPLIRCRVKKMERREGTIYTLMEVESR
ncbi:pilus assembly protein [Megasphaera vaginalis (ex Srinivasan et al. 2021)]|uniref:Uncharacterized protein n=1 Tax=Megasphaera vaginalis (ex Srinivasan et al. 2021) TaxID=1111454 RepID=U7USM0_9FIRM|nr:pilus assembly protein [Megasphaera vaginalis (ex Srinivasan et al. 2021)]ERT61889.1 hypothetical protein HMPREF1250_1956 [Megasphaera vaginalis (ex Srinivasan et al. 2021)]